MYEQPNFFFELPLLGGAYRVNDDVGGLPIIITIVTFQSLNLFVLL